MFDHAIQNGLIVDGTRQKPYQATLYLKDGKIAEISADDSRLSTSRTDAFGKIVSPGFIDIHSHSDFSFLRTPTHEGKLVGGVTFELMGQCGISAVPLCDANRDSALSNASMTYQGGDAQRVSRISDYASYVSEVTSSGISINLGSLIGHGTLRSYVIGWQMRQLTPDETSDMCALLDKLLSQGAIGLSFGLIYPPGSFCDTQEILALAKVVAKHDKIVAVHLRNENRKVFEALDEMIFVAKQTGVRLQISHFKLMGTSQWGRAGELLAKVDLARAQGVRIHCDQYPYCATSSVLTSCFPKWAMEGGFGKLVERLKDPKESEKIFKGNLPELENRGGPDRIVVSDTSGKYPEVEGMTLTQIAGHCGLPLFEAISQLLIRCDGIVSCTYHSIDQNDMLKIMSRTDIATVSDGRAYSLTNYPGQPHPRNMSSFPRFLRIVREEALMPIEDAIYKITALPAALMGLGDQIGALKPGYAGDVVVFDWNTVADVSTYQQPMLPPKGIDRVFVNGQPALISGTVTDSRAGRFYLKQ